MTDPHGFLLPYLSSERQEETYAHIASKYNRTVPPLGERVFSISFDHDLPAL